MNHGVVWIHALTPLHNGSGQGIGAIDRPINREAVTGYPFVQGSTLKGAARPNAGPDGDPEVTAAFGEGGVEGNQGAISWPDASILLFPVQSLVGTFVWTTCHYVLCRFYRDLCIHAPEDSPEDSPNGSRLGVMAGSLPGVLKEAPSLSDKEALGCEPPNEQEGGGEQCNTTLDAVCRLNSNGPYVLRDRVLTPKEAARKELTKLSDALAEEFIPENDHMSNFFRGRLIVVSDDVFTDFVKRGTPVEANIAVEDTGVTKEGSLRYTEFLPAETVLYSCVTSEKSHSSNRDASSVERTLKKSLNMTGSNSEGVMQLGGDESKGKGLVRMCYAPGKRGSQHHVAGTASGQTTE